MTELHWQVIILTIGAVAISLFVLLYIPLQVMPTTRSQTGRAILTLAFSVACLLDLSLTGFWFHYEVPQWAQTCLFVVISLGCCLVLAAFVVEQFAKRNR